MAKKPVVEEGDIVIITDLVGNELKRFLCISSMCERQLNIFINGRFDLSPGTYKIRKEAIDGSD